MLLRSNGTAVRFGNLQYSSVPVLTIPELPDGLTYTQIAAGSTHIALLRSDGSVVACGDNKCNQCTIPALDDGVTYTHIAAGGWTTVLIRSDGIAVLCELESTFTLKDEFGPPVEVPWIPELGPGLSYIAAAAGKHHIVLLRSDGTAVGRGYTPPAILSNLLEYMAQPIFENPACNIPVLDGGLTYTQVSAGCCHTILLISNGTAVACGPCSNYGQCDIPMLDGSLTYTKIAAGGYHTVLLKSNGTAVACGLNDSNQCDIPALVRGVTYTAILAGLDHTVLIKSNGDAVACGHNREGQCDILPTRPDLHGLTYTASLTDVLILQATYTASLSEMRFLTFSGDPFLTFSGPPLASPTSRLKDIYEMLLVSHRAGRLGPVVSRIEAILLPSGRRLSAVSAEETISSVFF